jgi:archaellum component FlaC
MQPKENQENEILIEVKKIGRQLKEFQISTEGRFGNVDKQFVKIDERFDGVDKKFIGIDQKFDGMDRRFDGVDQKFNGIDQRFDNVDRRLDNMDQRFDGVDQKFDAIDLRFDGVDNSIGELAIATAHEFEVVRDEMGKMATKTELHELKQEVMQAIDRVDTHLSATSTQWHEDFEAMNDLFKEHDLRLRVLEKLRRPA